MADVYASSGYVDDVQLAVNEAGLGDRVHIPQGAFNFVEVGEPWRTVVIPAGVNLFGAPTERTTGLPEPARGMSPNDQVVEWKTVLKMPWDVPGNDAVGVPNWFIFRGVSDPAKPSRFSDIKLSGYRDIDINSVSMHNGVRLEGIAGFRVDHCYLSNTAGGGISPRANYGTAGHYSYGVIDHCRIMNTKGVAAPYDSRTVGYGVYTSGWDDWSIDWDINVNNILGKYTTYSTYVENCYLEKWRHCLAARSGTHYVLRHSTIQYDLGYGSIDIHGDQAGRAIEVYDNELLDPVWRNEAIWQRAGAGVIFNNRVAGYSVFENLVKGENLDPRYDPYGIWVWNNILPAGVQPVIGDGIEGVDYFLYPMPGYTPYPYPHPLVSGLPRHLLTVESSPVVGIPFTVRRG